MENTNNKCPECGTYSLIPFAYGLMSLEARIERGKRENMLGVDVNFHKLLIIVKTVKNHLAANHLKV